MFLTTLTNKLRIARNEANEDTTLLDLTTLGDYGNMPALIGDTGIGVFSLLREEHESEILMTANGVELFFCAGGATGRTFAWRLLSWRVQGPAQLMAIGTAELGTQAVTRYPHNAEVATDRFWADHLTVTWYNWPKRVKATDAGNSNSAAAIWWDCCGRPFYKVEIEDADDNTKFSGQAGNVAAYFGLW
jgi:hypothetical protein